MSTSHTNLQRFTAAKAKFIQDARNLLLREEYVHGVAALDSRLVSAKYIPIFSYSHFKKVSMLQMGLESGLTTTSPEFLDMQPVSLLVSQERVAADVWFAALGDTLLPNYGVGGNPENQVGAPENTLPPMEPQTASLLTAPPPPLVPTTTNVPIVPSGPVPIPSPTSGSSPEPVPAPIIAASVLEADAAQITDPIPHPVPVLQTLPSASIPVPKTLPSTPASPPNTIPLTLPSINATKVTEKRPTTSGKLMELLELAGLTKRKRVMLLLTGQGGEEDFKECREDVSADGSDHRMDVEGTPKDSVRIQRQRKKRRVVSSATILSDDESGEKICGLVDEDRVYDGWEIYESKRSCVHCARVGVLCRSFRMRSHGTP